ncbi:uncharacterized protein [Chelonus insularis]|uniref:uncharacterized protein n=1 Tax=Chelonus insularis TaxID=460826 RepID=UPI00158D4A23|nr:uncharacterized protein LOC118073927 [Chelonus insularis]
MFLTQVSLIFITFLITSSHALFFHYSKNALMDFFTSLREKKEMKSPNVHHYHLHYYPVMVPPVLSSIKPIKAPDKQELENLHTNKLESHGWSNQEFKHIPDPSIHYSSSLENWSNSISYRPSLGWDEGIDRKEEAKSNGRIVVQVPLNQQIILQSPPKEEKMEKESNPLLSFFQKLRHIKNSIFQSTGKKEHDDDDDEAEKTNHLGGVVIYTHPNGIGSFFKKI